MSSHTGGAVVGLPLFQARQLVLRQPALEAVPAAFSFEMHPGENLALVGLSAPLQMRLLRAVALLDRPAAGAVIFEGRDYTRVADLQLRPLRRVLQFVGGRPRQLLSNQWPVQEILTEPLRLHRVVAPAAMPARVSELAQQWGLNAHLLRCPSRALSVALCLRVALARACVLQPRLLVCADFSDQVEPQAGQALLRQLAAHCRHAQLACLWVTTDLSLAQAVADRVLCLTAGQLLPA